MPQALNKIHILSLSLFTLSSALYSAQTKIAAAQMLATKTHSSGAGPSGSQITATQQPSMLANCLKQAQAWLKKELDSLLSTPEIPMIYLGSRDHKGNTELIQYGNPFSQGFRIVRNSLYEGEIHSIDQVLKSVRNSNGFQDCTPSMQAQMLAAVNLKQVAQPVHTLAQSAVTAAAKK